MEEPTIVKVIKEEENCEKEKPILKEIQASLVNQTRDSSTQNRLRRTTSFTDNSISLEEQEIEMGFPKYWWTTEVVNSTNLEQNIFSVKGNPSNKGKSLLLHDFDLVDRSLTQCIEQELENAIDFAMEESLENELSNLHKNTYPYRQQQQSEQQSEQLSAHLSAQLSAHLSAQHQHQQQQQQQQYHEKGFFPSSLDVVIPQQQHWSNPLDRLDGLAAHKENKSGSPDIDMDDIWTSIHTKNGLLDALTVTSTSHSARDKTNVLKRDGYESKRPHPSDVDFTDILDVFLGNSSMGNHCDVKENKDISIVRPTLVQSTSVRLTSVLSPPKRLLCDRQKLKSKHNPFKLLHENPCLSSGQIPSYFIEQERSGKQEIHAHYPNHHHEHHRCNNKNSRKEQKWLKVEQKCQSSSMIRQIFNRFCDSCTPSMNALQLRNLLQKHNLNPSDENTTLLDEIQIQNLFGKNGQGIIDFQTFASAFQICNRCSVIKRKAMYPGFIRGDFEIMLASVVVRVMPREYSGTRTRACEHFQWTWCEGFAVTGNPKCRGTNRHDKCPKYLANCTLWKHRLPPKRKSLDKMIIHERQTKKTKKTKKTTQQEL